MIIIKNSDILLKYGADPYVPDNDGIKPTKIAENFRDVIAVFDRHLKPSIPAKICSRCTKAGSKRCVKCRVVYYCSKECQIANWSSHKSRCKELCKSHMRVAFSDEEPVINNTADQLSAKMSNLMNERLPNFEPKSTVTKPGDLFAAYINEFKKKGNLLLKVQVAKMMKPTDTLVDRINGYVPNPNKSLLAYNEGRSFQCLIDPKKLDGPKLISIIGKKGLMGIKAYFWAYMEPEKQELVVITDPIHPAQPWWHENATFDVWWSGLVVDFIFVSLLNIFNLLLFFIRVPVIFQIITETWNN